MFLTTAINIIGNTCIKHSTVLVGSDVHIVLPGSLHHKKCLITTMQKL